MSKRIIIVGGANGVGKTTFAYQYRDEYKIDYLGADEIAAGIGKISNDVTTRDGGNLRGIS